MRQQKLPKGVDPVFDANYCITAPEKVSEDLQIIFLHAVNQVKVSISFFQGAHMTSVTDVEGYVFYTGYFETGGPQPGRIGIVLWYDKTTKQYAYFEQKAVDITKFWGRY